MKHKHFHRTKKNTIADGIYSNNIHELLVFTPNFMTTALETIGYLV